MNRVVALALILTACAAAPQPVSSPFWAPGVPRVGPPTSMAPTPAQIIDGAAAARSAATAYVGSDRSDTASINELTARVVRMNVAVQHMRAVGSAASIEAASAALGDLRAFLGEVK